MGWGGGSRGLDVNIAVDVHVEPGRLDEANLEARGDIHMHQQRHILVCEAGLQQGAVGGIQSEAVGGGGEAHGHRLVLAVALVESGNGDLIERDPVVRRVDGDGVVLDADLAVAVVREDVVGGGGVEGVGVGVVVELGDGDVADGVCWRVNGPQHQPKDERRDAHPDGGRDEETHAPCEEAAARSQARPRPPLRRPLRRRLRQRRRIVRLLQLREVERLRRRRIRPRESAVRERPRYVAHYFRSHGAPHPKSTLQPLSTPKKFLHQKIKSSKSAQTHKTRKLLETCGRRDSAI